MQPTPDARNDYCREYFESTPAKSNQSIKPTAPPRNAFLLATIVFASCNTFRVAGAPAFGRVHDVSVADIEAAVAAYESAHIHEATSVGQIQVISHNEVPLYAEVGPGPYVTMRRVHGKWRFYNTGGVTTS